MRPGQAQRALRPGSGVQAAGASPPAQLEAWEFFLACSHPCCRVSLSACPASTELQASIQGHYTYNSVLNMDHPTSRLQEKAPGQMDPSLMGADVGVGLGGLVEGSQPHKCSFQSMPGWSASSLWSHWKLEMVTFTPPVSYDRGPSKLYGPDTLQQPMIPRALGKSCHQHQAISQQAYVSQTANLKKHEVD